MIPNDTKIQFIEQNMGSFNLSYSSKHIKEKYYLTNACSEGMTPIGKDEFVFRGDQCDELIEKAFQYFINGAVPADKNLIRLKEELVDGLKYLDFVVLVIKDVTFTGDTITIYYSELSTLKKSCIDSTYADNDEKLLFSLIDSLDKNHDGIFSLKFCGFLD